jgi:hypothetical protein
MTLTPKQKEIIKLFLGSQAQKNPLVKEVHQTADEE